MRILAAMALALSASTAQAQDAICGDRIAATERLINEAGAAMLGRGETPNGNSSPFALTHVEIWVSPDSREWIMLAITRDGRTACLISFGNGWAFGSEAQDDDPA